MQFIFFKNGVNVYSTWINTTVYGLYTINFTANNISILTTDTITIQITTLGTGRTFNIGNYSSGNPYFTLTII